MSDEPTLEVSYTLVLKNREFLKLLGGQFFSNFGDAVLRLAIYLYVYRLTDEDLSLTTTVLAIQLVPWIIIGPIAGVFADRISRKAIMLFADLLRVIAVALIPFQQSIAGIMVIAFLIGMASSSFAAPRSAAIPEIVGLHLFVKAISISQLIFQTMSIIGPLLSAYIYAIYGPDTFFLASIAFVFSFVFIFLTRIPNADVEQDELSLRLVFVDLYKGFNYLFNEKVIRKVLILFSILILGGALGSTLVYPYIFEKLHQGNINFENIAQTQYGTIGALTAAGGIVGNLVFGRFENLIGRRAALLGGSLGMGSYFLVFTTYPSFNLLTMIAVLFGFLNGVMSLAVNAIFAETVPNAIRGRAYSATNSYVQVLSVISTSLSGTIAEGIGLIQTLELGGLIIIIFTLIMAGLTRIFSFANTHISIVDPIATNHGPN